MVWNFCVIIRYIIYCDFYFSYYGVNEVTKSTFAKTKAQIKSYQYYLFWGACTVAVMAGQIFVGAGYQSMSSSVKDLTELIEIQMEWDELDRRRTGQSPYMPMIDPDDYIIWETID